MRFIRDAIDGGQSEVSTVELVTSRDQQRCVVTGSCHGPNVNYWQLPAENNYNRWQKSGEKFVTEVPRK